MKQQWTPRCSKRIKEIYDNHPNKGNSFLEPRLNAIYEELRYKRGKDLSNFLENLRLGLKPQILEEEAKYQINFKLTKKNAQKIEYLKGKLGLTDSELITIVVLREEPSVEEGKEIPEIETRETIPLEKKPLQTRHEEIIEDLLANRCHTKYVDCLSEPFEDEDGAWKIDCPKQIWKKTRYGSTPTGKFYGIISIQKCLSLQKITAKWFAKGKTETKQKEEKVAEEEEGIDLSKLPKIREPITDEIVDQIGLCLNPLLTKERRSFTCIVCQKRHSHKGEACQGIQGEIDVKKSPVGHYKFVQTLIQRSIEEKKAKEDPYWWWGSPKTEDMTLEEIEKELGLRSNPPSYEDLKFDAYRKRYHEVCETCEEHLHHRCTRYCRDFLNGLILPQEQAS